MVKILLVEDDVFIRDLVVTKLQESSFDMLAAESGEQMYEILDAQVPDLILLDLELPDVHGFALLEQLKQTDKFAHIPVIIFSNNDTSQNRHDAQQKGAVGFYMKASTNTDDLISVITKHLTLS